MRNRFLMSVLIVAATACGCASSGHMNGRESEDDEQDEVKVSFADVPANVQAVLMRESKGATIASVDKEMQHGRQVYEADAMVDGKNREIVVAADGTLVHNKIDEEDNEKPAMGAKKTMEKDDDDEKEMPAMKK